MPEVAACPVSPRSPGDEDSSVERLEPSLREQQVLRRNQSQLARKIRRLGEVELSYRHCCVWFTMLACGMALVPVKDYFLGSYVTHTFDEVRDDLVARRLHNLDTVISTAHFYDTFARDSLPLFDTLNQTPMTRNTSRSRTLIDFLVHTSVSRVHLYKVLPEAVLNSTVSLMDDYYAPVCGTAWQTEPQLLFGNYFPAIHHEFCREFGAKFPRDRFFVNTSGSSPSSMKHVAPLGVIGLVNMTEVYLRHFHSLDVIRTLVRSILSGFLGGEDASPGSWQVNFSDATADEIIERYAGGVTVAELISLMPGAGDVGASDHVRLVDVAGVDAILTYFLTSRVLAMGQNVNSEPAVVAEISFAMNPILSSDYLVTVLGVGPVFSTYTAPFWNCGIELTTMAKDLALDTLDLVKLYRCGFEKASLLPAYSVNLLYLTQSSFRDYANLDNTSLFVVGPNRVATLDVPEKLSSSPLLLVDGSAWSKAKNLQAQETHSIPTTPFGYIYTRDCKHLVDAAFAQQGGRNVQKYQAYIGDGIGDCRFHDSQETELQVLCRLVFREDEILLRDVDGNVHSNISACSDFAPLTSLEQQNNFRQIEWFLMDTTGLTRRTRIRDNTSRQIRTFLLFLSLIGSIYYVVEYLTILKSYAVFVRNSLSTASQAQDSSSGVKTIRVEEFLQLDAGVGVLQHPISIVLLYIGAVGALSNVFSLACHAEIASEDGTIAIFCRPSIEITSLSLCFTVLSSGFWIALITQQTRQIGRRLRSNADPNWIRKWMCSHCAVLLIYVICKASTDFVLENVMLRSDPHIYAMCGGLLLSLLISIAFRIVHYAHRRSSPDKVVNDDETASVDTRRRRLARFPSFSAHEMTSEEQTVLSGWSSTLLDSGVLQHCAAPTIALQLNWYCALKQSHEDALLAQSTPAKSQSRARVASSFRVHEFVILHTAAGAWTHLETLAWSYDDSSQKLSLRRIAHNPQDKEMNKCIPEKEVVDKRALCNQQSNAAKGTAAVVAT